MKMEIVEREGFNGGYFYSIKVNDDSYYVRYEEDYIKTTDNIEYAARYPNKGNAQSEINLVQRFYDENG